MNNLSISQLFALQEKAATPIEHALRKAAKAKRASTRVKYIEQAREMVAGGNFAFTVTELEWLINNLDYLWGNAEAPQELVEPSAPVESAIADNAPVKPVFEVGQWVQFCDFWGDLQVAQITHVMPESESGIGYCVPLVDPDADYAVFWDISELADASLVYDQPSLPAPKFAIGDYVRDTRYASRQSRMIDRLEWAMGHWWYGLEGSVTVTWWDNDLELWTPLDTQAIVDHAFAWQAQRQADLTTDNAQAEKLIASFNAIEAYKAEVAYMQTQNAPVDAYIGGSENRKAER